MLVITRKTGQSVLLGDAVKITVVVKNRTTVKLLIDAPVSVTVVRDELVSKGKQNGQETAAKPD